MGRSLLRQERVDQLFMWAIGEQGCENSVADAALVKDSLTWLLIKNVSAP